ncbi:hypothetical protein NNL21_31230 [Paenibacillus mendelii]|nr:hypothetical protein [Paenibacillus mendelii]
MSANGPKNTIARKGRCVVLQIKKRKPTLRRASDEGFFTGWMNVTPQE